MVTSVPWQLASTASKDLDRLDATLAGAPARGPRVTARGRAGDRRRRPDRARHAAPRDGASAPTRPWHGRRERDSAEPAEAERVELTVGAVAHGGHCVARLRRPGGLRPARAARRAGGRRGHRGAPRAPAGRRGDVLEAVAGPGHRRPARTPGRAAAAAATCSTSRPAAQRAWKAAVVREQLARLGGLTDAEVDALGVRVERAARRAARLALPGAVRGRRRRPGRAAQAPLARGGADRPLPDRPPGDPGAAGARPSGGAGRTPTRWRRSPPPAAT